MTFQLKYCVWELTLKCNFNCLHCGSVAGQARENELTLEECYGVAQELYALRCQNVSLLGGEVFARDDWHHIAKRLISYGIHTNIITNGFRLRSNEWDQIKLSGIKAVCISIDGCEKAHDRIRRAGSFQECLLSVEGIKSRGYGVTIITTLNAYNIEDLEEMYKTFVEHKVDLWQLQLCAPFGNANNRQEFMVKAEQIPKVMSFICEKRKEGLIHIGAADNIGYFAEYEPHLRTPLGKTGFFKGCNAGINTIGIDSVGNIRGCESLYAEEFIEGNVKTCKLSHLWQNEKAFAYNRKFSMSMLSGKCAACDKGRLCAGGCRSMNYFGHGKLYESYLCVKPTGCSFLERV